VALIFHEIIYALHDEFNDHRHMSIRARQVTSSLFSTKMGEMSSPLLVSFLNQSGIPVSNLAQQAFLNPNEVIVLKPSEFQYHDECVRIGSIRSRVCVAKIALTRVFERPDYLNRNKIVCDGESVFNEAVDSAVLLNYWRESFVNVNPSGLSCSDFINAVRQGTGRYVIYSPDYVF
jgi:hypothetical protein